MTRSISEQCHHYRQCALRNACNGPDGCWRARVADCCGIEWVPPHMSCVDAGQALSIIRKKAAKEIIA